jgi:hypothetical protein
MYITSHLSCDLIVSVMYPCMIFISRDKKQDLASFITMLVSLDGQEACFIRQTLQIFFFKLQF